MKIKNLFFLLLLLISFTSCVEKITRKISHDTISPKYAVEKEVLKSRISAVIPAKNISFASTRTRKSGEAEINSLGLEIETDSLPASGMEFFRLTDELQEAVESGIENIEDYQKLTVVVKQSFKEDGVEHNRSYKKEIDL